MKIVFIKDYKAPRLDADNTVDDFKALDEVFVPRKLGQALIFKNIAISPSRKDRSEAYQILIGKGKKKKVEKKTPPKKKKPVEIATSKKVEDREKAIPLNDESE